MALRGKTPDMLVKRLKLMMFGPPGVGKTTAAIQFPRSYVIDCERGTDNYTLKLKGSNSEVFQCVDMGEIIKEVRTLATEKHDFRTLMIDPLTTAYNQLIDQAEQKLGAEFGRHIQEANKSMKRLFNLLTSLDMNVIVTCHAKPLYAPGGKMEQVGNTFDGWKSLPYLFDLVVELGRDKTFNPKGRPHVGKTLARYARVDKTRIDTFPDGEVFEWSYNEVRRRYDESTLERASVALALASEEELRELERLLEVVRLPEGTVEKWLSTANVEGFAQMPQDYVLKCISYVRAKLPVASAPAATGPQSDAA